MATDNNIYRLIRGYIDGTLSQEEQALFSRLLTDPRHDDMVQDALQQWILEKETTVSVNDPEETTQRINAILQLDRPATTVLPRRSLLLRTAWVRYAAAIIVLIGFSTWFFLWRAADSSLSRNRTIPVPQNEVMPGGNKAILTLADGTSIVLDTAANGTIAREGNARIIKQQNGQILYQSAGAASGAIAMNTMSTPRGGKYQLVLPDGSKAWLNAASSIRYPTAFTGAVRKVEITGEVYFEVKHQEKHTPFLVSVVTGSRQRETVVVLGTHFNVNAYTNEPAIRTTLLEGMVKVTSEGPVSRKHPASVVLRPGQQAQLPNPAPDGTATQPTGLLVEPANIDQVMAWKNDLFDFNGLELPALMRQLERWYNIEVKYNGPISHEVFEGTLTRDLNLSEVLKILAKMDVKYQLEDRTLTILP